MTFEQARAQFPVLERLAYLNAGTFGPLAQSTAEAVAARRDDDLELGRGGPRYFGWMRDARDRVRGMLAGVLGVEPANVALTRSTTDGCNIVLAGLELRDGDEVVTTDAEHFGLLGALGASRARVRVASVSGLPAADAHEAIRAEVKPRTRLIALSHVTWTTGQVLPVDALKTDLDVPILVDGAQSVGAIPVAAAAFDYYTVSCQKWLCAPDATGALYVSDPDSLHVTFPSYFSQDGYGRDGSFTPQPGARRFDNSWLAPGLLAGLEAALELAPDWRFERAAAMATRCRERLAEHFEVVTESGQATLVSFRVDGDPAALAAHAFDQGVVVRDLPGTSWLRASCGYWTSDDDIERLVAALA